VPAKAYNFPPGSLLARLGIVRLGLDLLTSGSQALPKLLARVSSGKGASVTIASSGSPQAAASCGRDESALVPARGFDNMAEYLARLPNLRARAGRGALRDLPCRHFAEKSTPAVVDATARRRLCLPRKAFDRRGQRPLGATRPAGSRRSRGFGRCAASESEGRPSY